jgi:hypothetical protein
MNEDSNFGARKNILAKDQCRGQNFDRFPRPIEIPIARPDSHDAPFLRGLTADPPTLFSNRSTHWNRGNSCAISTTLVAPAISWWWLFCRGETLATLTNGKLETIEIS